jgi:hypothetical protein
MSYLIVYRIMCRPALKRCKAVRSPSFCACWKIRLTMESLASRMFAAAGSHMHMHTVGNFCCACVSALSIRIQQPQRSNAVALLWNRTTLQVFTTCMNTDRQIAWRTTPLVHSRCSRSRAPARRTATRQAADGGGGGASRRSGGQVTVEPCEGGTGKGRGE